VLEYQTIWLEMTRPDLRLLLPGLQPHAVRALSEDIGKPLGAERFGLDFARPALRDIARMIRKCAE
jgi:hypothetical protein